MTEGKTYTLKLSDDMLMLLLRGGTVNYIIDGIQIRIMQETDLVIIKKQDYRDLKIHRDSPGILSEIFRNIDK